MGKRKTFPRRRRIPITDMRVEDSPQSLLCPYQFTLTMIKERSSSLAPGSRMYLPKWVITYIDIERHHWMSFCFD